MDIYIYIHVCLSKSYYTHKFCDCRDSLDVAGCSAMGAHHQVEPVLQSNATETV